MHSDQGRDMSPGIQLAEEIREGCLEEAMAILILKKLTRQRGAWVWLVARAESIMSQTRREPQ